MTKNYYPVGAADRPNKYRECQPTKENLEYFKKEMDGYRIDKIPVRIAVELGSYIYRDDDFEMFLSPTLYQKISQITKKLGIPFYTQKQ